MNKQKKIILISIITAGIILLTAIIAVTISLLGDKSKDSSKETTKQAIKEEVTTEKLTDEEVTTEVPTEEATTEEPATEAPTEEATTEEPTEAPTEVPTEAPTEAPTLPPIVEIPEEPMEFSVVDGVLYQSNSQKTELVEGGIRTYYFSPNNKAIWYELENSDVEYIRVVGQEKVEVNYESDYGNPLAFYDTGEAYFLGKTYYDNQNYWCRTTIYYFDGKELKVLTDRAPAGEVSAQPKTKVSENAPVIIFEQYKSIDSYEIDEFVIAFGDKVQNLDLSDAAQYIIHEQGKKIWYVKRANDITSVYEIDINADGFGQEKLIDSNIASVYSDWINGFYSFIQSYGDDVIYFKNSITLYEPDFNNPNVRYVVVESADMYISGKLVDTDVYSDSVWNRNGVLFYYTDYDVDKWAGVLNVYTNGNVKTLAIGVKDYTILDNGKVEITNLNGEVSVINY